MTDAGTARREAATVKRWLDSSAFPGESPESVEQRLNVLLGFFDATGNEPDQLVEYCFLRKKDTGDRFVSTKRRASVNEQIEAYVAEHGWTGKDAVSNGNVVRSFLIHNGIPIGGKAWTGGS